MGMAEPEEAALSAKWWIVLIAAPALVIAVAAWWILKPPPTVPSPTAVADESPISSPPPTRLSQEAIVPRAPAPSVIPASLPPSTVTPPAVVDPSDPKSLLQSLKRMTDRLPVIADKEWVSGMNSIKTASDQDTKFEWSAAFGVDNIDIKRTDSAVHPLVGVINMTAMTHAKSANYYSYSTDQYEITVAMNDSGKWTLVRAMQKTIEHETSLDDPVADHTVNRPAKDTGAVWIPKSLELAQ